MQNQEPAIVFDKERASSYDTQYAKLAPLRDALNLLVRLILSDLPADARVLCVGVGTGAELLDLARTFPQWRFTALEPAAPMLDICRERAEEAGIAPRCTFHEGYIDSLPASEPFDAATSVLVSHFITPPEERRDFYRRIAARLRPEGYLVNAALVSDPSPAASPRLFDVWMRMQRYADLPAEQLEKMRASYGREYAVQSPQEVASLIASGGFSPPVLFLQTLLIHAWYAQRTSGTTPASL
jgi:tRNA (cmo5U34)-methyltransferase